MKPKNIDYVLNESLWNNSFITAVGKPVFHQASLSKNILNISDLLTESRSFLTWQMAKEKSELNDGHFIDWLGIINSIPRDWKSQIKLYFSNNTSQYEAVTQHYMIPDMSVKSAYNSLVKSLPPTSKNTLEKILDISNVDWPMVTTESSLRIFQYKILNNILFLNNRLFKFGHVQSPLCSLRKHENETTKHLFSQCFITRRLWDSIKSWLMGSITLPPLNPDSAILGHWRPENKFNILVNHLILLFKFFIYKFKNHNFAINIYKFKLFTMSVQKVEQKIAYQNNKLTFHFDKWEPILHALSL